MGIVFFAQSILLVIIETIGGILLIILAKANLSVEFCPSLKSDGNNRLSLRFDQYTAQLVTKCIN